MIVDTDLRPRKSSQPLGELSAAVKRVREELHLTQQQFAVRLGVSMNTIARWETGRTPAAGMLLILAQAAEGAAMPELAKLFRSNVDRPALREAYGVHGPIIANQVRGYIASAWNSLISAAGAHPELWDLDLKQTRNQVKLALADLEKAEALIKEMDLMNASGQGRVFLGDDAEIVHVEEGKRSEPELLRDYMARSAKEK